MAPVKLKLDELDDKARAKAISVLGPSADGWVLYATKVGRKTVFVRDSGVLHFFVVGDDDFIYTDWSVCSVDSVTRATVHDVLRAAASGVPVLEDYRYPKP